MTEVSLPLCVLLGTATVASLGPNDGVAPCCALFAAERECVSVSNVASTMITLLLGNPLLPVVSRAM